jgi:hypothetical protein
MKDLETLAKMARGSWSRIHITIRPLAIIHRNIIDTGDTFAVKWEKPIQILFYE